MAYEKYINLIEEIPSGNVSVYSDEEDEELIITPIQELETAMENPPLLLEADEGSDSDVPLSQLITQDNFVWTKTMPTFENCTFTESTGPVNIPDDIGSPIDFFYYYFLMNSWNTLCFKLIYMPNKVKNGIFPQIPKK